MSIPRNLSKLAENTDSSGVLGVASGGTGGGSAAEAKTALGLHQVATTGSYADLTNKPTTAEITEDTNLYYTDARARAAISASGSLSYDSSTGALSYTAPTTSDITEGTNLYYTDSRARLALTSMHMGGVGSISYNAAMGIISYTGPSDYEIRSRFSAGTGMTFNSSTGEITTTITQYTDALAVAANASAIQSAKEDAISFVTNGAGAAFDTLKEIQDAMATDVELANAISALTIGNGTQTITAAEGLTGGGSFSANQTSNSSVTLALAAAGIAGTYTKVTTDGFGRVVSGGSLTAGDIPSLSGSYLPLSGGTLTGTLYFSNATSPNTNFIQFGDNTGWKLRFMTNVSGTPTERFSFSDGGEFNSVGAITQAGNQVLHATNYNGYVPSLTGSGASGTWNISITGSAGSVAWSGVTSTPTTLAGYGITDAAFSSHTHSYLPLSGGTLTGTLYTPKVIINSNSDLSWGGNYGDGKPTIAANATTIYFYPTGNVSSNTLNLSASATNSIVALQQNGNQVLHAGNYTNYSPSFSYFDDYTRGAYRVIADYSGSNTWYIRSNGRFTWARAHDWSQTFELNLEGGTTGNANAWAEFGQRQSNNTHGTWFGTRFVQYLSNGKVDGKVRAGQYYLGDDSNYITGGGSGAIRSQTSYGYLDVGAQNSSWAHFQTDRPSFYFNKDVSIDGQLYKYNGGAYLHSGNYSSYVVPLSGGTMTGELSVPNISVGGLGRSSLNSIGGNIGATTPSWNNSQLEIKNTDAGSLGIAFHRAGYTSNTISVLNDGAGIRLDGSVGLHAGNYSSYALPLSGGSLSGNLTYTNLISSAGSAYGIQGNNGYFDTVNSGADGDPLELVYVRGNSVKVGSGTYGSKPLYAVGIYDNGSRVLSQQGSTYYQVDTWLQMNGTHGLYWPSYYGAHLHANDLSSYGPIAIRGSKNGYQGIAMQSMPQGGGNGHWMSNGNATGYYNESYGWKFLHESGVFTIYSGTYGGGSGYTALHSGNYTSYSPSLGGSGASGTWSISISGSAASAGYMPTYYTGGQQTNPQVYFNEGVGLRVAMTGVPNVWSDTLWINGYSGSDVPNMCALHTIRNGQPRMWISSQSNRSTSYGTYYEFLTAWNYNDYSPTRTGGGASGTWSISVTGNAGSLQGYEWFSYGKNIRAYDLYADNWIRNYNTNTGLYNEATNAHWYSENNGSWTAGPVNTSYGEIRLRQGHQGSYKGSFYWDGSGVGLLNNQGGWSVRCNQGSGYGGTLYGTWVGGNIRSGRADGNFYIDDNYGNGIVGIYSSYRYQMVYAMGDSYKMSSDGTSLSNMYGIAWSHPNAGGAAGNLTDHGMLIIDAGGFRCAISNSIVASGNITAYSDERLKTNWRSMPDNYVARLAEVKVGIYDRTDETEMSQVGVSAQSFQKLLPEAILTAKDEMQTLSVSYGNAALASAVELAKHIVKQDERIAKLEALIETLLKDRQ